MAKRWKMVIYRDGNGYSPYLDWVSETLTDDQVRCLERVLHEHLFRYGNSKAKVKWLRDLNGGLYQLRVQGLNKWGAKEILLRVYLHFFGDKEILFISGYDKAIDSSPNRQQSEIISARKILENWIENE